MTESCDLFLTHAWRYHDDWKRMVDVLNTQGLRAWRNFSLPWYDPALDPRTPEGGQIVCRHLETQIIPCDAVLLLSGVYQQPGCRKWVDMEVEMAHRHGKPIIAIPAIGAPEPAAEVRALADAAVGWDAIAIMEMTRQYKRNAVARGRG
jgi:hypothetical protein